MFDKIFSALFSRGGHFHAVEVYPNLFQGSQIVDVTDLDKVREMKIQVVIDLEGGFDPPIGFLDSYLYWPIIDLPILPNLESLFCVASFGALAIYHKGRVLVHCRQGLNRSGLVCGRIMSLDGVCGPDILKTICEKVPGALWNPVFREYVRGL
jgi:protein-tyrosine phosphatase